ncbi:MAG TPA: biotin--[acetyl-CoA-carboxylase] ligase [Marmoricola sp.]|nr:biotin--[acetyl-CoA-carboxylase] ligase [Marmoricola sp.]HNI69706.1 biotin--[acetyl-CoA-carboxylase] ligase [Marmoricola sp.]HNJ78867.1 biotin--[acetyl-CoA-carboxylase] ligase [Marmoricola sp.]HNN47407.1 biotin--[acetyl-CoA-carboxylase] ligase [Marmoricola sp.]HNO40641.1 biotin--[acetyl-CoA-carboxylase] ligase [Marmoricola sp.]
MNSAVDARPPLEPNRLHLTEPFRVEVVESLPSTNQELGDRFTGGAGEGLVLVAEHQTSGRGRLDREWVTPARSAITASLLLTPQVPAVRWTWLPLLTGLAATQAIRDTTSLVPTLKWPNDVLLEGRKVGGILLERIDLGPRAAAIVGIGLNVHQTQAELPVPEATSIAIQGADVDRTELLQSLVNAFSQEYSAWIAGTDPRERYLDECGTVGQEVVVHTITEDVVGVVTDIDDSGQLVVDTDSVTRHLAVGDVEYVRPQAGI